MATDSIIPSMASLRSSALPTFTTLLGTLGMANGLYSLSSPTEAAEAVGVVVVPSPSASSQKEISSSQSVDGSAKAYIHFMGARNLASGTSLLALTAYWQFSSLCRTSPLAALAVKRSLGILLLTGTTVAFADGVIISRFAREAGISDKAREVGSKAGPGHMAMAVPILGLALAYLYS